MNIKLCISSALLSAFCVFFLVSCSAESGHAEDHTHSPSTIVIGDYQTGGDDGSDYVDDDAIPAESDVLTKVEKMADQVACLPEGYTITSEGVEIAAPQGFESVIYRAESTNGVIRMTMSIYGDGYLYSENEGGYITDFAWLYEKCGKTDDDVISAVLSCWDLTKSQGDFSATVTGALVYDLPQADSAGFEAVLKESDKEVCRFAVLPNMKTVYIDRNSSGSYVRFGDYLSKQ